MIDFSTFHLLPTLDLHLLAQTSVMDVAGECLKGLAGPDNAALNCSAELSKLTAQQWDGIWQQKVGNASPEFTALMNISRYIAGPAVALWGITAIKDLYRNGIADGWQRLAAIIVLVFVLYSNDAYTMRQTTLAMRSLINYQNETVLELTNVGTRFEEKLAEITDYVNSEDTIRELRSQCNGKTANDEFLACLEEADIAAKNALEDYKKRYPDSTWVENLGNFLKESIENPMSVVAKAGKNVALPLLLGPLAPALGIGIGGHIVNSAATLATNGMLASLNYVAQNIVEVSWLFTAIIVPIPLALAFYPGGKGALIGWAVGFLTIGLFKINLNIASSLIVSMIYERGPGSGTIDLMLLSFGVIFIASLMTAGGGYAIFNGIMTAVTTVTLGVAKLGATAASGGIAK